MLRVYPLRGEEEAAYRQNNNVDPDTVVFCADDGERMTYPTMRRRDGVVTLTAFCGDDVMDEMFIRAAASYGEYRGDTILECGAPCSQLLLVRIGFTFEDGRQIIPISRIIHYDA